MANVAWRASVLKSLKQNASLPNAKYIQVATVRPDGKPANRSVVFRGFLGDTEHPTFVTDARSEKVSEIAHSPWAEVCWYLPITREQYRLTGSLRVIDHAHADVTMQEARPARAAAWRKMSEGGRAQFAWPHPGIPRLEEGDSALDVADKSLIAEQAPPLDTFCLVVMHVTHVDHLSLKKNRRYSHTRAEGAQDSGQWTSVELNP